MKIIVRKAVAGDKINAIYTEGRSTPNLRYIERMWDDFISNDDEPLFVAEIENKIVGIGKFSILFDGSAWLETLRVDKDYQGMGIGKAIYQSYLSQAELLGVKAIRMYTGVNNAASAGLARINGFELAGQYSGADLVIDPTRSQGHNHDFKLLETNKALDLFAKLKDKWAGFMIFNRTFYQINDALARGMVKNNNVYYSEQTKSFIVVGARFMPERGLNVGMYCGNSTACLDFAVHQATKSGVDKISIMFPPSLNEVKNDLTSYGFEMQKSDCIVMECCK